MKRNAQLTLFALLILAAGPVLAQTGGKHAAEMQAIRQNEMRWNQEFAAKDLEKIVAHYAADAVMTAPGLPAFDGREAIHAALKEMLADPGMTMKFQPSRVEIGASGDMASTMGTFVVTMTDQASGKVVTTAGHYVTVYRKEAGEWKAVFDIASAGPEAAGGQKE